MDNKQTKQEALLTELESIKDLLDGDCEDSGTSTKTLAQRIALDQDLLTKNLNSSIDIPVLNEMVIEDDASIEPEHQHSLESVTNKYLALNELAQSTLPENVLPGQQALFEKGSDDRNRKPPHKQDFTDQEAIDLDTIKNDIEKSIGNIAPERGELPDESSSENPFLPKHIRDRLTKPADLEAILAGHNNKRVVLPPIIKTTVENSSTEQDRLFSGNFSGNSFLYSPQEKSDNEQSLESALNQTATYKESLYSEPLSSKPLSSGYSSPTSHSPTSFSSAHSSKSISESTLNKAPETEKAMNLLIDGLIAQYLPEIEAKLRFQLKQSLINKPQKK